MEKKTEEYMQLKRLRKQHKMTQEKLAGQLDISVSYLSEIENGKKNPSLKVLKKTADCFGCPVKDLFDDETEAGTSGVQEQNTAAGETLLFQIIDEVKELPRDKRGKLLEVIKAVKQMQ